MAVEVVTKLATGAYPEKKDTYAEAESFFVKEGHLIVTRWVAGSDEHRAAYAPGEWVKAYVVEATA